MHRYQPCSTSVPDARKKGKRGAGPVANWWKTWRHERKPYEFCCVSVILVSWMLFINFGCISKIPLISSGMILDYRENSVDFLCNTSNDNDLQLCVCYVLFGPLVVQSQINNGVDSGVYLLPPPKFNSSPLKIGLSNPIGKDHLPTTIFQGRAVKLRVGNHMVHPNH